MTQDAEKALNELAMACKPCNETMERVRIIRAALEAKAKPVDVDSVYRLLINKFNEYKNEDTSRPASFYDDKKPVLLWAIEYLAARGLIGGVPDLSIIRSDLIEAKQKASYGHLNKAIKQIDLALEKIQAAQEEK